jgi:hypothetical protein
MTALEQLARWKSGLEAAVGNALEREVFDVVRSEMKDQIEERVYAVYEPSVYIRRGIMVYREA